MPRLLLYPFRVRDAITKRWRKARYVAEAQVIAARYPPGDWEIIALPEVREVDPTAGYFSPWRRAPRVVRLRYPLYEAS
jgi:hypothetical protein